ncbi:MAG: hypothetical protein HFE85_01600 [Clostridiales bacterium]|nr:hypothetical protein [Clostridiales bacterium]
MTITLKHCCVKMNILFLGLLAIGICIDPTGLLIWAVTACALHEIGHLLMMQLTKCPPSELTIGFFGAKYTMSGQTRRSYKTDALIALAGPLMNLLVFFTLYFCSFYSDAPLISAVAAVHFGIASFNLLPVMPLDGGRALYSILCHFFGEERALKFTRRVSFVVLVPLAAGGLLLVLNSPGNFTLLLTSLYLTALLLMRREA